MLPGGYGLKGIQCFLAAFFCRSAALPETPAPIGWTIIENAKDSVGGVPANGQILPAAHRQGAVRQHINMMTVVVEPFDQDRRHIPAIGYDSNFELEQILKQQDFTAGQHNVLQPGNAFAVNKDACFAHVADINAVIPDKESAMGATDGSVHVFPALFRIHG